MSLPCPRSSGKTCSGAFSGVPTLKERSVLLLFRIVGNLIIIAFKYPTDSAPPFCLHLGQTPPVALSLIYHWKFESLQPPHLFHLPFRWGSKAASLCHFSLLCLLACSPLCLEFPHSIHTVHLVNMKFKIQINIISPRSRLCSSNTELCALLGFP